MSWKNNIQVRDMDDKMKLECTCLSCGHHHYLTKADICQLEKRKFLYLDEVEKQESCRSRGCRGHIRILLIEQRKASPFVGGLA